MKTPEIIVKGADSDMKTMKLSDFCQRVVRKNSNLESERVLTISAQYGLIDQGEFFNKRIASNQIEGYYLIKKGEFAYNKSYSADYPVGAVKALTNYEDGVLSTLYVIFENVKKNLVNSNWLQHYFESNYWHREILERASEGARNHGLLNISAEDFLDIPITIPSSYEVQKRISEFLDGIDNYISSEEKKLENLRNTKNAYLIKLFPKEGETEPEIRFECFEGNWKTDIGNRLFRQYSDKGYPYLPVLSATQDQGMVLRDNVGIDMSYNKDNEVTYKRVKPGQFVIHLRSFQGGFAHSDVEGITSPAYTVFGLIDETTQDDKFWSIYFTSKAFIKRLELVTYGIRDGRSIDVDGFMNLNLVYPPTKAEQSKIASFFISMDKCIKASETNVSKLQQLRKGLLERMFVDSNKD